MRGLHNERLRGIPVEAVVGSLTGRRGSPCGGSRAPRSTVIMVAADSTPRADLWVCECWSATGWRGLSAEAGCARGRPDGTFCWARICLWGAAGAEILHREEARPHLLFGCASSFARVTILAGLPTVPGPPSSGPPGRRVAP